jgi:hypothetical protein
MSHKTSKHATEYDIVVLGDGRKERTALTIQFCFNQTGVHYDRK